MSAPDLQHLLHLTNHATPGDRAVTYVPSYSSHSGVTYISVGDGAAGKTLFSGRVDDPDAQLAAIAPETLRNIVERLIAAERLAEAAIKWRREYRSLKEDVALLEAIDAFLCDEGWCNYSTDDYNHNGGTHDLSDRLLTEPMDTNP